MSVLDTSQAAIVTASECDLHKVWGGAWTLNRLIYRCFCVSVFFRMSNAPCAQAQQDELRSLGPMTRFERPKGVHQRHPVTELFLLRVSFFLPKADVVSKML